MTVLRIAQDSFDKEVDQQAKGEGYGKGKKKGRSQPHLKVGGCRSHDVADSRFPPRLLSLIDEADNSLLWDRRPYYWKRLRAGSI